MVDSRLENPCLNAITCKESPYCSHTFLPRRIRAAREHRPPPTALNPTSAFPFAGARANSTRYCRFPLRTTNRCARARAHYDIREGKQTRQPVSAKKERKKRRSVLGGGGVRCIYGPVDVCVLGISFSSLLCSPRSLHEKREASLVFCCWLPENLNPLSSPNCTCWTSALFFCVIYTTDTSG